MSVIFYQTRKTGKIAEKNQNFEKKLTKQMMSYDYEHSNLRFVMKYGMNLFSKIIIS